MVTNNYEYSQNVVNKKVNEFKTCFQAELLNYN